MQGWRFGTYFGCCSAYFGPRLSMNQLKNIQNMSQSVSSVYSVKHFACLLYLQIRNSLHSQFRFAKYSYRDYSLFKTLLCDLLPCSEGLINAVITTVIELWVNRLASRFGFHLQVVVFVLTSHYRVRLCTRTPTFEISRQGAEVSHLKNRPKISDVWDLWEKYNDF